MNVDSLKVSEWKRIYSTKIKGNQVAILVNGKIEFNEENLQHVSWWNNRWKTIKYHKYICTHHIDSKRLKKMSLKIIIVYKIFTKITQRLTYQQSKNEQRIEDFKSTSMNKQIYGITGTQYEYFHVSAWLGLF